MIAPSTLDRLRLLEGLRAELEIDPLLAIVGRLADGSAGLGGR